MSRRHAAEPRHLLAQVDDVTLTTCGRDVGWDAVDRVWLLGAAAR